LNVVKGDFRSAHQDIQKGFQLAQDIHHREWHVSNLFALGIYYSELFLVNQAQPFLVEALEFAQELRSQVWINWVSSSLGNAYILANDLTSAKTVLGSVTAPGAPMDTLAKRRCWALQARLALHQEDPQQALRITDHLIESTSGMKAGQVVTYLWLLKGAAFAKLGNIDQALKYLQQARQNANQAGEVFLLWRVQLVRARLLQSVDRKQEAENEFAAAEKQIQEIGDTIDGQELKTSFLAGATGFQF